MIKDTPVLAEFYSFFDAPQLYKFDIDDGKVESVPNEELYKGFFVIEDCIFPVRKITFAIYIEDQQPYFYCERELFEINDSFSLKRYSFLIYTLIIVRHTKSTVRFWQRTRDIDPFYMNDFFSYLVFIIKTDFDEYVQGWPHRL